MLTVTYRTAGGLCVTRATRIVDSGSFDHLVRNLNDRPGIALQSTYSYPGRYTEHAVGFVDPPISLRARADSFTFDALNPHGLVILQAIARALSGQEQLSVTSASVEQVTGLILSEETRNLPEELRSKQPTIMTVLRSVIELFRSGQDDLLGLYGAVGYDVVYQFEKVAAAQPGDGPHLVMYLPDHLISVAGEVELEHRYEIVSSLAPAPESDPTARHERCTVLPGAEYADERTSFVAAADAAQHAFVRGDLFEVVISRSFARPTTASPSTIFRRLQRVNPAPYGMLMNLDGGQHLVSASPEMFVRVGGRRVESCPIAGTAPRGANALDDARNTYNLLSSDKDTTELVMCVDVDRNDKSRICEPGTVNVLAYRQIEAYSRVVHTVAHIEGMLRPEFDSLDAFLSHMWAVTVTGAPKIAALSFIAEHERGRRRWYGGAFGKFLFNGDLDTAVTLRTIHIVDSVAHVRAGSTLLFASESEAEADETEWKAAALLEALDRPHPTSVPKLRLERLTPPTRVLLLDHEDSFVHTLADYLRQAGAVVTTRRVTRGRGATTDDFLQFDLVCLSPGPGAPAEFGLEHSIHKCMEHGISVFGVCLGMQGIVEYFRGRLDALGVPAHGRQSEIRPLSSVLFSGIDQPFAAGRYHSLIARVDAMPLDLCATAMSEDGVVMAVEHVRLPIFGVQFHPESIMTTHEDTGLKLIRNVLSTVARGRGVRAVEQPPAVRETERVR